MIIFYITFNTNKKKLLTIPQDIDTHWWLVREREECEAKCAEQKENKLFLHTVCAKARKKRILSYAFVAAPKNVRQQQRTKRKVKLVRIE